MITEFLAPSPKSYSYKYCKEEVKKAKGVSLAVRDKTMAFADYNGFRFEKKSNSYYLGGSFV